MHIHHADSEVGQKIGKQIGATGLQSGWPENADRQMGLLVAKIAHSFAVACRGIELDGFDPLLPDIIRGVPGHLPLSYLIGCMGEPDQIIAEEYPGGHTIRWFEQPLRDLYLLIVQIRLFANFNMPSYSVVVGATPIENMERMMSRGCISKSPTRSR